MIRFNLPVGERLLLFLCVSALCLIVGSVISGVVLMGGTDTPRVRVATILQDIVIFIVPAICTAVIITRQPADFLLAGRIPAATSFVIVALTLLVGIPAMESVINWNASIELPESWSSVAEWMKASESRAAAMVETLIGRHTASSLIVTILIVGVLAGFSEELFFRGTIQRLLITSNVNHHVAIWGTAVLFSAVHMQFFGFVPRMLLGAYFGYLAWWTRSLWLPVFAHCFNNSLAGFAMWHSGGQNGEDIQKIIDGPVAGWVVALISVVLTGFLIYYSSKFKQKNRG